MATLTHIVGFDGTAAWNQRAGIGRYARSLLDGISRREPEQFRMKIWLPRDVSATQPSELTEMDTGRFEVTSVPVSQRMMTILWNRVGLPIRIEKFVGPVDVVHGPDFVVPPSKAPSIATIHDLSFLITPEYAHPRLRRYLSQAVPRSIKRATKLIAVSETTRADIIDRYDVPEDKVITIHNGISSQFQPASGQELLKVPNRLSIRMPFFLTVGTIEPRKNHLTLLRAFREYWTRHRDAALVIIGRPGWLSDQILYEIDRLSQSCPVFHLQNISDDLLPALYSKSIGFIYPSWYEGFGLPVLEAMACGAPTIASDIAAHREVAQNAALYADPNSIDALISSMERIAGDQALRARLRSNGRDRALQFSWDQAAEQHLRLYESLVHD